MPREIGDAFPVVHGSDGSAYAIIPDAARVLWTELSARDAIDSALADETQRDATIEVALQLGATSRDHDEVSHVLVRALVDGTLVAFEAPAHTTGRPITQRRAEIEPPIRPPAELTPAWVSFELVDHEGAALGDRDITFEHADGRLDSVTLDSHGRSPRVTTTSAGGIHLEWPKLLEAELDAPRMDGFVARPDDVSVKREPRGATRLGLNRHWRIVVAAPPRQATTSFPSSVFASASALPMHAISDVITRAQETCDRDRAVRIGLFAHSDLEGDAASNKELSDRRAQAVFALMTGDWPRFEQALAGETLPDDRAQALLRALGCNPTAIDGEPGEQTALAVRAFRRSYNRDVWHTEGRARAFGDLAEGDALDEPTRLALVDAYHAEYSGRLDPARFHGPRHAGCSEFNPRGSKNADNRRVTLVVYGNDAPAATDFPCKMHDAGACKVDGGGGDKPHFTCKFYRERIGEVDVDHELTPFWDFEWLRTTTGKAHLSALTHLPDSDDVTFDVARARIAFDLDDYGEGEPPSDARRIVRIPGVIRSGVAYALWDFGDDEGPFDVERWFRAESPRALIREFAPYYFTVAARGLWGRSSPPSYRLPEMSLGSPPQDDVLLALRTDGTLLLLRTSDVESASSKHRVAALTGLRLRVDTFEG